MSGVLAPSLSVVKTLFALSCNVCAYPGCEERLTNPDWQRAKGRVCHIRGERPGSARWDEPMTDAERAGFDNLVLLCPNHHVLIDDLEPEKHTVEWLTDMKRRHEDRCGNSGWLVGLPVDELARLLLDGFKVDVGDNRAEQGIGRLELPKLAAAVAEFREIISEFEALPGREFYRKAADEEFIRDLRDRLSYLRKSPVTGVLLEQAELVSKYVHWPEFKDIGVLRRTLAVLDRASTLIRALQADS